jgi:hypothetical protein
MNWKDLAKRLGPIAPAIGTAMGGPMGGMIGATLAARLGTAPNPDAVLAAMDTDPDADEIVREVAHTFEDELKLIEASEASVSSAREAHKDSKFPAMVAAAMVIYFGLSLFLPYFVPWDGANSPGYLRQISTLENLLLLVAGFYFGSNFQSSRKTELIAEAAKK